MRGPARAFLLAPLLVAAAAHAQEDNGPGTGLVVGVAGITRSGTNCHVSFQVRNRLPADLLRFAAGFVARDATGAPIGAGVFATGRVRRLQPYQRVASFVLAPDEVDRCAGIAVVEIDVRTCVLDGSGDVGPVYCREAITAAEGVTPVTVAGAVAEGPVREAEVAELGLVVSPLTAELARAYGISGAARGLVVTAASDPGGRPGLREGDLLIEVDQDPVDTVETLLERVRAARGRGQASVLCMVFRGGGRYWLAQRLADG